MAKQRKTIEELAAGMGTVAAAPSVEDWKAELDAELGPATSDGPGQLASVPDPEIRRDQAGPNTDLTPPEVNPDPWWEVTCPEFNLPRRDIQAPNEQVAALLYNQSFHLRRPKPTVRRIADGLRRSDSELASSAH